MFVERKVCYSALFTNLVGWHVSAVSFPLSDIILAQLVCPLSDVLFCLHSGITYSLQTLTNMTNSAVWRHDTLNDNILHNDTQHNDTAY